MKNLENYVNEVFDLEHNRLKQENRNLKDNTFELERRLTRVLHLNDRYEHLLMQINLEMYSLKRDNYVLQLRLADLTNAHEAQMLYLKRNNDKLNIKLKNILGFHQKMLNGFKFIRKKINLMRQINLIYEHRLKIFNILKSN